jgi:hypothetical protein
MTLLGINKGIASEIEHYLSVAGDLLSINDSVKHHRYEWILGFPQVNISQETPAQTLFYRVGVQSNTYVDDITCEYRSTAFKTSTENNQSLLSLLFTFRKRWAKFTLEGLISVFKASLEDTSGDLYRYLHSLDAPTIQYARYLDWVIPYIKKQHDTSFKNSKFPASKEEFALALQANSLVQRIIQAYPYSGNLKR